VSDLDSDLWSVTRFSPLMVKVMSVEEEVDPRSVPRVHFTPEQVSRVVQLSAWY
jgi:hypothetical protein